MDKRYGILIVNVTILVLCFAGTASATNWSVDGSGGADFTVIQEAINNASVGDTIIVHSGVYYEKVVVNKSVTLKGNGQPVIDAGGEGDAIRLTADGITLVGFNATNSGSSWSGFGITVTSNNNTITGNNVSSDYAGIYLYGSSNNTITGNSVSNNNLYGIRLYFSSNNTITGNNVSNNDAGIGLSSSSNNIITGNNVSNNDASIDLSYSSNNTITGNNVSNNNRGGVRRSWGSIRLSYSSNNTITGNNVSNNNRGGISLSSSSNNNTITGNNVSNNNHGGIRLSSSSNNTITGNVFVNDGLSVYFSYQNIVEDNTVNGKPLVYLEDVSDYKVEDAGQVILLNCDNIIVKNLDLSNTYVGIELWKTENSKISNNTVCNNRYAGIELDASSSNNTITGNNVSNNNGGGIRLSSSSNNTITGNNVSNNNGGGISLSSSSNNTITGNNVSNNNRGGIYLYDSSNNNTITGNNVSNNNHGGIRLSSSSNNTIYFNNFINNTDNVYSYDASTNIWNPPSKITYTYDGTTYESYLGNYWDDYNGTDAYGDGIGDTHYNIDSKGDESDDYPLMQPFENYILTTSAPA